VLDGLVFGLLIGLIGRAYARAYLELGVAIVDPWILVVTPIPLIGARSSPVTSRPARRGGRFRRRAALRIALRVVSHFATCETLANVSRTG
jgi:hypothetical protein